MPGFTIDTRSEGDDENTRPHVELYHSDTNILSMIQSKAIESITEHPTKVYDVSENTDMVSSREVMVAPTTIVLDNDYVIERWEGPMHADTIREVLDAW